MLTVIENIAFLHAIFRLELLCQRNLGILSAIVGLISWEVSHLLLEFLVYE